MKINELLELKKIAEQATKKWKYHERNSGTINNEFEIINENGGVLFRSTNYRNMENDAKFIAEFNSEKVISIIDSQIETKKRLKLLYNYLYRENIIINNNDIFGWYNDDH